MNLHPGENRVRLHFASEEKKNVEAGEVFEAVARQECIFVVMLANADQKCVALGPFRRQFAGPQLSGTRTESVRFHDDS